MANVAHRQAQLEAIVAGPDLELVATRAARPAEDESMHRIVVIGGGAAGLELATRLGDRLGRRRSSSKLKAQVMLVECARTHLWKPLLYEVAAGSLDPGEYEVNYLAQAHWHGFRYRFGEMIGLDRAAKEVRLAATFDDEGREITPAQSVGYDTLVIAIGSVTNDFGTPGIAEHAVPLETPAQAARFNRRLVRTTRLIPNYRTPRLVFARLGCAEKPTPWARPRCQLIAGLRDRGATIFRWQRTA